MVKYKVNNYVDDIWEVLSLGYIDYYSPECEFIYYDTPEKVYKGSLSDCEAFIKLKEGGYL